MILLDTNVTIWAFQGKSELISKKAFEYIETNDLFISPMVKLELEYLYEIGKAKVKPDLVINSLYQSIGLTIHDISFHRLVDVSISAKWTRDPFDRLIASHAKALDAILLTKDAVILKHYKNAVW